MRAADDGVTGDRPPTNRHRPAEELSSGRVPTGQSAAGQSAAGQYPTGQYPTGQFAVGRFARDGHPVIDDGPAPSGESGTSAKEATRSLRARGGRGRSSEVDFDDHDHDRTRAIPPPPLRTSALNQPLDPERGGWAAIGAPSTPSAAPPPGTPRGPRLRVDWPNCKAHGLCHELLPEAIRLDEWGYPIIGNQPLPSHMIDDARRAVTACPTLALRLVD